MGGVLLNRNSLQFDLDLSGNPMAECAKAFSELITTGAPVCTATYKVDTVVWKIQKLRSNRAKRAS